MTTGAGPELAEVQQRVQRMMSLLEDRVSAADFDTATGEDAAKTVQVTTDGRHRLTKVSIERGLLRLGADAVAQRVTEALRNAHVAVTATNNAAAEQLKAQMVDMAADIAGLFGDAWPLPHPTVMLTQRPQPGSLPPPPPPHRAGATRQPSSRGV